MQVFENTMAKLHFDEGDNILFVTLKPDALIDQTARQGHYEMILEATQGKDHSVLIDAGSAYNLSHQAFEFATESELLTKLKAAAFCGSTLINRLQIMQFQKVVKNLPIEIFGSREEALKWLRTQPLKSTEGLSLTQSK